MIKAELAGRFEAPLYGMLEVAQRMNAHDWGALGKPAISLHGQPVDESRQRCFGTENGRSPT